MTEQRVWITERKVKSGKVSYALRWICPNARRRCSEAVGTDKRRPERAAAKKEDELENGTYTLVVQAYGR